MDGKTLLVVFVLFAILFGGCGINFNLNVEQGSGNVISENRTVANFDHVSLAVVGETILIQGQEESLQIEAEDNIIANIKTEVRAGTLYITYERKSLLPTKPIKFTLNMREVRGLEALGMNNLSADVIATDQLNINISGAGSVRILQLTAERVNTNISGAGNVQMEGVVSEQKVTLSGAGNYNGEDLQSKVGAVTIAGLGKVSIWATDQLDVIISGTGDVSYYGEPKITQTISGIGNLHPLGNK